MTCREMFARLSEYLDGELTEELCRAIQAHLDGCGRCQAFAASLRRTVDFCRQLPRRPLPEDVREDLRRLIERECRG